jgi:hypothetical protein
VVGSTNYHFPAKGEETQMVLGPDGVKTPRKMVAQVRILETLMFLEERSERDPKLYKHFLPRVFMEVFFPSATQSGGTSTITAFDGDPDKPFGESERNMLANGRAAWDEFLLHRGQIAYAGQWLDSPYTVWRKGEEAKEKAAQEAANVVQQKNKPVGSHK